MSHRESISKGYQQLRWKLTLSYAGVTVGVLLTLELILLGLAAILISVFINNGYLPAQLIEATSASYTPVLRTFLQQIPPQQEAIGEWLDQARAEISTTFPLSFDVNEKLMVVGSDGILLGATPQGSPPDHQIGQLFDYQAIPGLTKPLQAAFSGEGDSQQLYALVRPENDVILAIPIWDTNQEFLLGVLIAIGEIPTLGTFLGDLLPIIGVSTLFFLLVAGLIGTAYGYLASRGPVRRLSSLSEATGAWSRGDFTRVVEDPSLDEIGHLARRLNHMAQQLEQLLDTRRELAVVEERNRLARELHDSAKQQAFAAAAQVSAAKSLLGPDPEAARLHIEEAEGLIFDLRQELSILIQELRPAGLKGKGLASAVGDFAEDWSRQTGIAVEIGLRGERSIPLESELTLFRIFQEALANVARHSQANKVGIRLLFTEQEITLTVNDDGLGYTVDEAGSGFGLSSMKERAEGAGGKLSVQSTLGKGTLVSCTIPAGEPGENAWEKSNE